MIALTVPQDNRVSAHTAWTGLEQFDNKTGHQGGDAAIAFSPGNGQLFNTAIAVLELGHTRFDDGLKLAGIQVSPLAFAPAVDVRSLGVVGGVSPHLASSENNLNHNTLLCQRKVHRLDRPRCFQSKKVLVQRSVFHGVDEKYEKLDSARTS